MGVCCAVDGCLSSAIDKIKRNFYRFPLDETRCRLWVRVSGRADLERKDIPTLHKSYRICDLHFVPSDHFNRYLKHNAVPSLNLPQPENDDKLSKYTQTDMEFICRTCEINISTPSTSKSNDFGTQTVKALSDSTPTVINLRKQLTYQSKRIKMLEDQLQKYEDNKPELSPNVPIGIETQNYFKLKYKGNRYDHETYKEIAMDIYSASPLAYRILAKTLCLPSERTLRRKNIRTNIQKISSDVKIESELTPRI